MIQFAKNCYSLFCHLVFTIALVVACVVGCFAGIHYLLSPEYEPATHAVYYYDCGEASTHLNGAVDLLIERGYPIQKIQAWPGHAWPKCGAAPSIEFQRADGTEIVKSRLAFFWTMYDVKIRFGRE